MAPAPEQDGVHAMVPPERMDPVARKYRDTYAVTPGAPFVQKEFGYYCLERWYEQGLDREADLAEEFGYDTGGKHHIGGLGWCEAGFVPEFTEEVIEDRGEHEVYRDRCGRHVLVFKGRRSGFMPEYLEHPVKDMNSWVENCRWRMDPETPERWEGFDDRMAAARDAAGRGLMMTQQVVGAYMYLRSLIGPADVLYAFYDMPDVIHDCMRRWLELADAVIARHQEHVTFDELFFGEDICYNHGPLVSPEMIKEFLFPYYRELARNMRARQIDSSRHLHVHIDTDGFCDPVIALYTDAIGMDAMSPFEVASDCDVVRTGREWPRLAVFGGIDKRVLAKGKAEIDEMVERIIPPMHERGGYIPTCDHGVPEEVTLENYRHYRSRCLELGG